MLKLTRVQQFQRAVQAIFGLIIINFLFLVLSPTYRQIGNFQTIFAQATVLGIMASGSTIVLISGGLDLSVGSLLTLTSVLVGTFLLWEYPVWLCVLLGLFIATGWGLVNGLIVIGTGIPPFIVTLGMMMVLRGLAEIVAAGKDMSSFPRSFRLLGSGYTIPVLIMALVYSFTTLFLSRTKMGFYAYAIGGNPEVARLAGIRVNRLRLLYYALGGFMAGLAAVVLTARLNFANSTFGQGMELNAIAAAVIGGTSLSGGVGGALRTIVGVLIMTCLSAGLSHLGIGSSWQRVAIGIIIILAVWFDTLQRRRVLQ
jgi:ribose/xylose/arabinose/galactoside ABC-type transport system permease subunit